MKSTLLLMLLVATVTRALGAQVAPGAAASSDGATIIGEVVADGSGIPIPYTTVRLQPLGRERFTDKGGSFVYYGITPGSYSIQVRMVGFMPIDSTINVRDASQLIFTLTLRRIPTSLEEVQVKAPPRRCLFHDEYGYVSDPELGTVLDEAKKNAQREQLLRGAYPFEYKLAQSHDTYNKKDSISAMRYDTVTYRSDDSWRYRKGRVVSDDRNRIFGDVRLMRLPTLADLSDRTFLAAHCFKYSGIVDEEGKPAHRIDFLPDSNMTSPDVEGSIFLDSATFFILRAQFRLTRGTTMRPPILGMEVTTTYKEILPNVTLFDQIRSVQPLPPASHGGKETEFREVQKLISYRFLYQGPNGSTSRKWIEVPDSAAIAKATPKPIRKPARDFNQELGPPP